MLINASDLDTSPPEYVVEGMLPDFGVGFGYGDSYTGKTLALAIELCLAVANGVPYFGHETVQGGAVWCLGEGLADAGVRIKARLVREHTDRMTRAAQIELDQGAEAAAAWLAQQPPYTDDRMKVKVGGFPVPFLAATLGPGEELRRAATELSLIPDLRLVVLDTARRYTSQSLSNGTTSNRFMQGMSWLASQLQCTVLAIGHPVSKGRGETGLPGDTLFGSSDFVWRIRAGDDSTDDTPNALIIAEKVKSGPLFGPVGYELERIRWQQPPTDPVTGEDIPGAPLITVSSVTVRQRADEQAEPVALPGPRRTAGPLPLGEMVTSDRAHRRTGLRPRPFRAVRPAGPPEPAVVPEEDPEAVTRAALVAALISVNCPDCPARAGTGCAPGGTDYTVLAWEPLVVAHVTRMDAAVQAGAADPADVLAQFHEGTAPEGLAVLAGTPS